MDAAAAQYPLSLASSTEVLNKLYDGQREATLCDVCGGKLVGYSYTLCTHPEPPPGQPIPEYHETHTGCEECVFSRAHVADGGACKPCLNKLGNRRSNIVKAGVALIRPARNMLANKMMSKLDEAEERMIALREQEDEERRRDGADRRAKAVQDVREKRVREEEQLQEQLREERKRREEAEQEAAAAREEAVAEADRLRAELDKEAERQRSAAKEEAKRQRQSLDRERAQMERDVSRQKAEAEKLQSELEDKVRRAERKQQEKQRPSDEQTDDGPAHDAAPFLAPSPPPKRQRRQMTDSERLARSEKQRQAWADKKAALSHYPLLLASHANLQKKLEAVVQVSVQHFEEAGMSEHDTAALRAAIEWKVASIDRDEQGEEEGSEEGEDRLSPNVQSVASAIALLVGLAMLAGARVLSLRPRTPVKRTVLGTVTSVSWPGVEGGGCKTETVHSTTRSRRGRSRSTTSTRYSCTVEVEYPSSDADEPNKTVTLPPIVSGKRYVEGETITLYELETGSMTHEDPNRWRVVIPLLAGMGALIVAWSAFKIWFCLNNSLTCGAMTAVGAVLGGSGSGYGDGEWEEEEEVVVDEEEA